MLLRCIWITIMMIKTICQCYFHALGLAKSYSHQSEEFNSLIYDLAWSWLVRKDKYWDDLNLAYSIDILITDGLDTNLYSVVMIFTHKKWYFGCYYQAHHGGELSHQLDSLLINVRLMYDGEWEH